MKKPTRSLIGVVACAAALSIPATGAAGSEQPQAVSASHPPLSFGRGKKAVLDYVVYRYPGGYRRNSLLIACSRHDPYEIGCDVQFTDRSGRITCGNVIARKRTSGRVVLIFKYGRLGHGCGDF